MYVYVYLSVYILIYTTYIIYTCMNIHIYVYAYVDKGTPGEYMEV
jgi:hypothetical protein